MLMLYLTLSGKLLKNYKKLSFEKYGNDGMSFIGLYFVNENRFVTIIKLNPYKSPSGGFRGR